MLRRMARTQQQQPPHSRVDYRWRVDSEEGFEQTSYLYDANGRLAGIDYKTRRAVKARKPAGREA
jgi:hypothetical protein